MKNRTDVDDRDPMLFHAARAPRADEEEEAPAGKERSHAFLEQALLEARTILVSGQIDDQLATAMIARLLVLENRDASKPITLYINSPGGSADSGFAMYDMLRFVRAPIRTLVSGLCASAAVLVFLGGDKGTRLSLPGSRFLLHQPSTMGHGSAEDLRITAEQIVKLRERYNAIVAEATGKPAAEVLDAVNRDFWLSASEALEWGLVDRLVSDRGELG